MLETLDYSKQMSELIADIASRCAPLSHIQAHQVLVSFSHAKIPGPSGLFAKITPLKFEGGESKAKIRGRWYQMPELNYNGHSILYIIYLCIPKFLNLPLKDKLVTIFHELYHISPLFNGDIRRFPGRNYAHGPSKQKYNELVQKLVDQYLLDAGDSPVLDFLKLDAAGLSKRYKTITVVKVPQPKPFPLPEVPK